MADLELEYPASVSLQIEAYCVCGNEIEIDSIDPQDFPKYPIMVTIQLCQDCMRGEYNRGVKDAEHGMGVWWSVMLRFTTDLDTRAPPSATWEVNMMSTSVDLVALTN